MVEREEKRKGEQESRISSKQSRNYNTLYDVDSEFSVTSVLFY